MGDEGPLVNSELARQVQLALNRKQGESSAIADI